MLPEAGCLSLQEADKADATYKDRAILADLAALELLKEESTRAPVQQGSASSAKKKGKKASKYPSAA